MNKQFKTSTPLDQALPTPVEQLEQAKVAEEMYNEPVIEAVLPNGKQNQNAQTDNKLQSSNTQSKNTSATQTTDSSQGKPSSDNIEVADYGQLKQIKPRSQKQVKKDEKEKIDAITPAKEMLQTKGEHPAAIEHQAKKKQKEGVQQAIQEDAKKQAADTQKFNELVETAGRPLMQVSSTFPFDLFPDRLTIEETRVNLIFRTFFATEQIRAVQLNDIMEVQVQTAIFFATLKIISRTFNPTNNDPLQIQFLRRSDAQKARRLIEGLKIARQEGIDATRLSVDELVEKAEELGRIHELK